ncbi:hypothetical protein [Sporomusa sp. KB1]|uniref:hypothetical protein n=1 Tax=Sporomusa sp. KB1 TaxID=943346 RepID=UPI0011A1EDC2|nr:hypothetical protein [Sporomusa sp. KB1]
MDIQDALIRMLPRDKGLNMARQLANISYVGEKFFVEHQIGDINWQLSHFLEEEADSFVSRFDSSSYLCFLHAMRNFNLNFHNLPLADCPSVPKVLLVGCEEDILFPVWVVEETESRLSNFTEVDKKIVSSKFGHDAFLMDDKIYSKILKEYFLK